MVVSTAIRFPKELPLPPATQLKFPRPSVVNIFVESPPVILTPLISPKLEVPFTARPINSPTLVMLGCAAAVTVPAVVAFAAAAKLDPPAPFNIRFPTICRLALCVVSGPVISTTGTIVLGAMLAPMSVSSEIVVDVAIFSFLSAVPTVFIQFAQIQRLLYI